MQKVTSKDGTQIAFEKSGKGPALVIIGGSLADHNFYSKLADELSKHYTVYNFDRRGRGESGDTQPYAVEREVEDVAALIANAKKPVFLYGHSAGSALALRAAAAGLDIAKLVLADPPFTPHSDNDEEAKADFAKETAAVQELHDKGDHKGNAARFLGSFGLSEEDVEGMLQSPMGEGMIDCARALPYDYAMLDDGLTPTALAAKVEAPVFILAAKAMPEAAKELAQAMPNAKFEAMEASTHEMSPADIAKKVVTLLIIQEKQL
jgi:pimeloyl-ACP methyl ester carboxylesterase